MVQWFVDQWVRRNHLQNAWHLFLEQIRNQFPGNALSDLDKQRMITAVQDLYILPPYNVLNLWPATRDWLLKQGIPPHLFVNP